MKRWCVEYTPEGEVTRLYASQLSFLGAPPSQIAFRRGHFYYYAIDEMGAFAQFKAAWKKKEQDNEQ